MFDASSRYQAIACQRLAASVRTPNSRSICYLFRLVLGQYAQSALGRIQNVCYKAAALPGRKDHAVMTINDNMQSAFVAARTRWEAANYQRFCWILDVGKMLLVNKIFKTADDCVSLSTWWRKGFCSDLFRRELYDILTLLGDLFGFGDIP